MGEAAEGGVGDPPDPRLQRAAVFHQLCHQRSDRPFYRIFGSDRVLDEGTVSDGERLDPFERDEGVPVRARHLEIDLRQQHLGGVRRRARGLDRGAQGAEPVRIGRGELQQRRIQRHPATGEQAGDVGEEDRHEIGPTLRHRVTELGRKEERDVPESSGVHRVGGRDRAVQMEMIEPHSLDVGPTGERFEQGGRCG